MRALRLWPSPPSRPGTRSSCALRSSSAKDAAARARSVCSGSLRSCSRTSTFATDQEPSAFAARKTDAVDGPGAQLACELRVAVHQRVP